MSSLILKKKKDIEAIKLEIITEQNFYKIKAIKMKMCLNNFLRLGINNIEDRSELFLHNNII